MLLNREYIYDGIEARRETLEERYRMYCSGFNEVGAELTPGSAAVARSLAKTDLMIITFVEELVNHIDHDFELSNEGAKGYEKLIEPYERHRNYRG
jgi:hypothetical protein